MYVNCLIKSGQLDSHDFARMLDNFGAVIDILAAPEPSLSRKHWRMTGDTLQEAQRHPAYNENNKPNADAIEMLDQEFRKESITCVSIWDGSSDPGPGASIECYLSGGALSDSIIVDYDGDAIVTKDITAALLVELARSFGPTVIEASPRGYSDTKAFLEKPGVGWMLYLPKLLQTRDVPEAEQLIPVRNNKGNSIGTVIVSVSDTVFSLDNPTHLEIAHSIEARLISNGWLPSYVDISRS